MDDSLKKKLSVDKLRDVDPEDDEAALQRMLVDPRCLNTPSILQRLCNLPSRRSPKFQ